MAYKKKKKTIVYQWKKGRVESLRRNMAAEKHPSMPLQASSTITIRVVPGNFVLIGLIVFVEKVNVIIMFRKVDMDYQTPPPSENGLIHFLFYNIM